MYQHSLASYIRIFTRAVEEQEAQTAESESTLEIRLRVLIDRVTASLYRNVCRSLYERHKLLFSFVLTTCTLKVEGKLEHEQLRFFLTGGSSHGQHANSSDDVVSLPLWLPPRQWEEILRLASFAGFESLPAAICNDSHGWQAIHANESPHTLQLPAPWRSRTAFDRLCILRCLRSDKLIEMIHAFVSEQLGPRYVEPPPFRLDECYAESSAHTPLIFILSSGVDPSIDLLSFSETMGRQLSSVSLGQGQGPIAERCIANAQTRGDWVVLQNCHLGLSFMPTLEKICDGLASAVAIHPDTHVATDPAAQSLTHPDFRLWLTSKPTSSFPVSILKNGVKMVNEPPSGLRGSLLSSFGASPIADPGYLDDIPGPNGWAWRPMLFALTYFHAVVQERRRFGSIGWNNIYNFNKSDLQISMQQLRLFLETSKEMPFEGLRYCTGELNYGGSVTDAMDSRLLEALLAGIIREETLHCGQTFLGESFIGESRYVQPTASTHEEYLAAIRELPIFDAPEAFGLHANAAITKDLKETSELLDEIMRMQPRAGAHVGLVGDASLATVAADIAQKLPADFNLHAAKVRHPPAYLQSLNTVLSQELSRYNVLLQKIRSSLSDLGKAIEGLVVMSAEMEVLADALTRVQLPDMWRRCSYLTRKPLASYVVDLGRRLAFFTSWVDGSATPSSFWASAFFFPQGLLTATRQNFARKRRLAIDELDLYPTLLPSMPAGTSNLSALDDGSITPIALDDGLCIYGLFIEGARYEPSTRLLCESEPNAIFTELPTIRLQPMLGTQLPKTSSYGCPLYKVSSRNGILSTTGHSTNFVMCLQLPSNQPEAHWVRRGVAALMALDD